MRERYWQFSTYIIDPNAQDASVDSDYPTAHFTCSAYMPVSLFDNLKKPSKQISDSFYPAFNNLPTFKTFLIFIVVNIETGNNGGDIDGNDDYISDDGYADIADPTQRIDKHAQ